VGPPNRRRSRLVDSRFQLGLAWRMLLVFLLFFFGGVVLVFAPSMIALFTGESLEALEPAAVEFLVLHKRVWPAVLFVLVGLAVYTVLLSHRIAGPVYRINSVLRKMLDGEFPPTIAFRRGDYFGDTAQLLERLSRKLAGEGKERREPGGPSGSGDPGKA
jgi:hypothetical protein